MKKKTFYLYILGACMAFNSCSMLDLAPEDYYGEGNFWNNEEQVEGYMNGLHTRYREKASFSCFNFGEFRSGMLRDGMATTGEMLQAPEVINNNLTPQIAGMSDWAKFYDEIIQVNILIDKVEGGLDFLTIEKANFYLAQAYGLRALYYSHLVRSYAGVPIVKSPILLNGFENTSDLYTPRSTEEQTLDFIKSDILKSEELFADDKFTLKQERSIWSKAATLMLKAEMYLWSGNVEREIGKPTTENADAQIALDALNEIQASGKFKLESQFKNIFNYKNKGNDEIIFAVRYKSDEASNNFVNFVYSKNVFSMSFTDSTGVTKYDDPLKLEGRGTLRYEYKTEIFQQFDNSDSRKRFTFFDFYKMKKDDAGNIIDKDDENKILVDKDGNKINEGNPLILQRGLAMSKFIGTINSAGEREFVDDYVIYRYADLLLLKAEAKNCLGQDPSKEINDIRERAYRNDANETVAYPVYADKGYDVNAETIFNERTKEFIAEGKRWYDARRLHTKDGMPFVFSKKILAIEDKYKLLFPINSDVIAKDPTVEQNPGY